MLNQTLKTLFVLFVFLGLTSACKPTDAPLDAGKTEPETTEQSAAEAPTADAAEAVSAEADVVAPAGDEDCKITPLEEPIACTMQYDPVCGCDGKTYSNACSARAAGVPKTTPGACEENPVE